MSTKTIVIGSNVVTLPGSLRKVVEIENLKIVLFETVDCEPHTPEVCNRNIIAFDFDGSLVWKIQEIDWDETWRCFSNISVNTNRELIAYGDPGYDYIVNPLTGEIKHWRDPKWPPGYKPRPW
jgi:hypothetical protein